MTDRQAADAADESEPQCGFHARNPFTGTLGQCISPAETNVVVAVTTPDGTFKGDGVRVGVCERHADELESTYRALPTLTPDATLDEVADYYDTHDSVTGDRLTLPNEVFDALAATLDGAAKAVPELVDLFKRHRTTPTVEDEG